MKRFAVTAEIPSLAFGQSAPFDKGVQTKNNSIRCIQIGHSTPFSKGVQAKGSPLVKAELGGIFQTSQYFLPDTPPCAN